jgi:hypothetical protein
MKLWQRVLLVIASVAALYALWRYPPAGITAILLGACGAWVGRSMYSSKLAPNPIGENRDYSLRPVAIALAKGVGSFAAALLLTALGVYAVTRGYVPDTPVGVGVALGPALLLFVVSVIYLIKALTRFQLGGQPPAG